MPKIKNDQQSAKSIVTRAERPEVELFDPWQHHFVSQHKKNDFFKSLEGGSPPKPNK